MLLLLLLLTSGVTSEGLQDGSLIFLAFPYVYFPVHCTYVSSKA